MAEENPFDMVYMTHPDIEADAGPVARVAFEEIHKAKGWQLISQEEAVTPQEAHDPTSPKFRPPAELTELTKDELQTKASQAGVSTTGTKEDIAKRVASQGS